MTYEIHTTHLVLHIRGRRYVIREERHIGLLMFLAKRDFCYIDPGLTLNQILHVWSGKTA